MWKWEAEGQPKAVVVIVHNVYEHHRRYAWLIQRLRSSQFHVVMGDLPGHGEKTRANDYIHNQKIAIYDDYVKNLLQIGIEDGLPLFVIGHGFGATLMMRTLQKERIECAGVILSSPWLHLEYQPSKYLNVLAKLSSSMIIDHHLEPQMLTRNVEAIQEMADDADIHSKMTTQWYRELQIYMKTVEQSEQQIPDIPILIHNAGKDDITSQQYTKSWLFKQTLSELQYKNWKELYHDVYQEPEREEVFLYTESFMHSVLRSLGYIIS